jgi:putative addiction module CopG family antidote
MSIEVDLGPYGEQYIQKLIESGRYTSVKEAMRVALRLLRETEERLSEIRENQSIASEVIQACIAGHDSLAALIIELAMSMEVSEEEVRLALRKCLTYNVEKDGPRLLVSMLWDSDG